MSKKTFVPIRNNLYTIELVNKNSEHLISNDPNIEILGRTLCLEDHIYIRNDLSLQRLLSVIIHEITHAFVDAYGFAGRNYTEEELCTFLETYASDIVSIANTVLKELTMLPNETDTRNIK